MAPKKRASGRHAPGSRTKAVGNPQPSGWAKFNEKQLKLQEQQEQAELEQIRQRLRENAEVIAAVPIDDLLDVISEVGSKKIKTKMHDDPNQAGGGGGGASSSSKSVTRSVTHLCL
jgi:hypothetical protein